MGRLGNDESNLAAMVIQDPAGAAVLGAAGAQEDNDVAARAVVEIQKRAPRTGRRSVSQLDRTVGGSFSQRKRSCSKRQAAAQITVFDQQHPQLTFGAVYEHRDSCGKPKLLGSTSVMPERQFAIDLESADVRSVVQHGSAVQSEVVWAGIGSGVVGEAEMAEIRHAVLNSRSERLKIQKLSGIKPYSHHS